MQAIVEFLRRVRLPLHDEKQTQSALESCFKERGIGHQREFALSKADIVDFLADGGIAIEIKLKGSRTAIFRQLERYAQSDKVTEIVLLTGRCMHLPTHINGKRASVVSLSTAWL